MCCFNQQVFGSIYAFLFSEVVEARAQPLFLAFWEAVVVRTLGNLKIDVLIFPYYRYNIPIIIA